MSHENPTKKYPEAFSAQPSEGGYTFLKRMLKEALKTKKPVIINMGTNPATTNYLEYRYDPGQETFLEGLRHIEGTDKQTLDVFKEIAGRYKIKQGVEEIEKEM